MNSLRAWLLGLLLSFVVAPAAAEVGVHVFWQQGCPHCERAIAFLAPLAGGEVDLRTHEISAEGPAREAFMAIVEAVGIERPSVPMVVIGNQVFLGFDGPEGSGRAWLAAIEHCRANDCVDLLTGLQTNAPQGELAPPSPPPSVRLPLLGELQLQGLSLPALTALLGTLDGFNPCAMWVLVFLLGLLVPMQDALRRWTLGAAFLLASAGVYFLFMAAWLNALQFMAATNWVRSAIAVVALAAGGYYLIDVLRNPQMACPVGQSDGRRKVFERLRAAAAEPRFLLALAGIVGLAVAVNLVELLCSAGLPAVYAQVLAMNELPAGQHYAYLALYLFFFMLDDLAVFAVAMITLQVTGLSARFARVLRVGGGVLLLGIGLAMLFRPEWLSIA